jgi:hypothetical protein
MCELICRSILTICLAALPSVASAQSIELEEQYPLRQQPQRVVVMQDARPLPRAVITARYRPNSETTFTETLTPTDGAGSVIWTPRDAGIVTLEARASAADETPIASRDVAVRFERFPPAGLAIMIIAALILFGGAGFGMTMLLRGPLPEQEPPST